MIRGEASVKEGQKRVRKIKKILKSGIVSRKDLATHLESHPTTISGWVNGHSTPVSRFFPKIDELYTEFQKKEIKDKTGQMDLFTDEKISPFMAKLPIVNNTEILKEIRQHLLDLKGFFGI